MIKEIKISFEKTIKRIEVPQSYKILYNYLLGSFFHNKPSCFSLVYYDKDGDCIDISNEDDYQGAVYYMSKNNIDLLRCFINFHVKENNVKKENNVDTQDSNPKSKSDFHFISFLNDFLKFAHENYIRIDLQNRKYEKSLSIFRMQRNKHLMSQATPRKLEKAKLIYEWLKAARIRLKYKKFDNYSGHFISSIEGYNKIRIRYIFNNSADTRDSKSKTVNILAESYDVMWEFEYGVEKMFNFLCYLCENFMNLSLNRCYRLSDF
jgi:hypothetical protein